MQSTEPSMWGRFQQLLTRCPFLRNLLHKLFSRDEALFDQELCQCVSLSETGDEKLLHCNRLLIWFWHCASSLDDSVRSHQDVGRNRQSDLLGGFEIDYQLELSRLLYR